MERSRSFLRRMSLCVLVFILLAAGRPNGALAAAAGDSGGALKGAILKTAAVKVYRMDMDERLTGAAASAMGGGAAQEVSVLALTGEISDKNAHITMSGLALSALGGGESKGVEIITVGGQSFIHGPVSALGATENKWYRLPSSTGSASYGQTQNLGILAQADLSSFTSSGKEALDSHNCDIYASSDKQTVIEVLQAFIMFAGYGQTNLSSITSAELKFWVCDDGYFHRMTMAFSSTDSSQPAKTSGARLFFHVYDFNGKIVIAAPTNAVDLPSQSQPYAQADGELSAGVVNGGNIRLAPNTKGAVLGQMHAGEIVTLRERTLSGVWYKVDAREASGWVHVSLLRITPATAGKVFVNGEAGLGKPLQETLMATVTNGGNRRAAPNNKAPVLGQLHAGQQVQLLAKTKNGAWYYARCGCPAYGWVHASLLKIDPKDARKVPVA